MGRSHRLEEAGDGVESVDQDFFSGVVHGFVMPIRSMGVRVDDTEEPEGLPGREKGTTMKKSTKAIGIICAVALSSAIAVPTALAAGNGGRGFADANGDGICDRYIPGITGQNATGTGLGMMGGRGFMGTGLGANFVDADGDGICDNIGTGLGRGNGTGVNFVDADGDGICDNLGTGIGGGNGTGANYVDANGDGICDNAGSGLGRGAGNGYRSGR